MEERARERERERICRRAERVRYGVIRRVCEAYSFASPIRSIASCGRGFRKSWGLSYVFQCNYYRKS